MSNAPWNLSAGAATGLRVSLRDVRKIFPGGVAAVAAVTLDVAEGQFVSLLGPSGCGKSTLLRLIARLDHADGGTIHIDPGSIACVFQDAHLMPWRNVLRNVELPLELRGVPRHQRREAALAAIERVGLSDALTRYPAQLSGGMRMRASLARALVTGPRLLLLDEPFAALDELTRQRLDEQLYQLWRDHRMTVIFVTHSISEATYLAQRAVVLTPRPARVVLDHSIELPVDRSGSIRTSSQFARQAGVLYEALRRGERPE